MKYFLKLIYQKKYTPEVLFMCLFFFSYAPHFIYSWFPQILNDSYAYIFQARDIYEGKLPFKGHRMDLPYAYSIFIAFLFKLGGSFKTVILVQTLVSAGSFIFLINTLKRIRKGLAIFGALSIWLYVSSTQSLLWNTLIYTESFYSSNLVMATAFILLFSLSKKIKYIYFLGISILAGFMTRSNGLYLFFIPAFLLVISLFTNRSLIKHIVISSLLTLFVSSAFNSVFKGTWFPSETLRIFNKISGKGEYYSKVGESEVLKRNQEEYQRVFNPPGQMKIDRQRSEQTWKLLTHLSNSSFGQHYYYRMPRQINKYFEEGILNEMKEEHHVLRYKTTFDDPIDHMKFFFTNIDITDAEREESLDVLNIDKKPRNIWLLANHIIDLSLPFTRNFLLVIIFYLSVLISIFKFFKSSDKWNSPWLMILFVTGIHLFSIALLGASNVSNNAYPRYAYVSEFIGFIVPLLFSFYFFKSKFRVSNTSE